MSLVSCFPYKTKEINYFLIKENDKKPSLIHQINWQLTVEPPFNQRTFYLRTSDYQYMPDYYHRFISPPKDQLSNYFSTNLKTEYEVIEKPYLYLVKVHINRLYTDVRKKKDSSVIVTANINIYKIINEKEILLKHFQYHGVSKLKSLSGDNIMTGISQCLAGLKNIVIEQIT
jgi:hypothetical protein